ncbi:MAG: hypothetical protein IJN43_01630 [Ruminococcus sp.]|nr:hypothetical protein [Ruminococcus sp.]
MNRNEERAYEIIKLGKKLIAEKQRKTAIIKRTAYSVSGICAAAAIGFGIWNNDAIKNSADFDKYNSSTVVENSTEPAESGTFVISSESTVKTTTSTAADTVKSAETSEITTAEITQTQRVTAADTTAKKTAEATMTTASYTQTIVTITQTQLAGNVTVTNTQTTKKPTTMPITTNDEPTTMPIATNEEPTTMPPTTKTEQTAIDKTLSLPASSTTLSIQCTATVTSQSICTATSIPLSSNPAASIPNNSTTDSSISTFTTTVSDTGTTVTSISEPFTSVTTATGGNSNTTPVLELIIGDKGELTDILYDGVIYHNALSTVDTAYLERDKRKYLGDVYYNRIGYCSVYYVYDYKEQGKPALVLAAYKGNIYRLFLME